MVRRSCEAVETERRDAVDSCIMGENMERIASELPAIVEARTRDGMVDGREEKGRFKGAENP